jgi:NADH-quinone oxidoreductase subunit J
MEFKTALFYVFSAVLVASALRVVTARNPVHAALYLVLAFFNAAGLWMMLKAEFLAITLVLVYVGAVMVLFLFVVMMLDIDLDRLREGFWKNLPVAAFVGIAVVLELSAIIWARFSGVRQDDAPAMAAGSDNTRVLGKLIYTNYVYPFELAAVLLLVAMVAAIALTLRRRKDTRVNDAGKAQLVRRADRVRLVTVPAVARQRAAEKGAAQ